MNPYRLIILLSALTIFGMTLATAAEGYREVATEQQQAYEKQMRKLIKKKVKKASKEVQKLYGAIDYQPVWVDRDFLSVHTEMLLTELKNDFAKGLHTELKERYLKLLPDTTGSFTTGTLEEKVDMELAFMQLYADSIDAILEEKQSKYTAASLLQKAVREKSLLSAIDDIADIRIIDAVFNKDLNISKEEAKQAKYRSLADRLMGEDREERLKAMYELIGYKPLWVTQKGLTDYTGTLFSNIENDITLEKNGTIYQNYLALKNAPTPATKEETAKREFAIARLYQEYMGHVLYGDIDWKTFQRKLRKSRKNGVWTVHKILNTPESLLIESLSHKSLQYAFEKAKPPFPLYDRMLEALKTYQGIAAKGGWEPLPEFDNLKPGASSPVVHLLRKRLAAEGDYTCDHNETGNRYSGCLLEAVKRFQRRHGLTDEGYVGKLTRKALAESVESKIAKLKLNLDRLKWLKRGDDTYHFYVNIPSFTLFFFKDSEIIEEMRVIGGRKGHETPIFYSRVRTMVLNPYWRIPPSIIRHETIPKLKRDPGYTNKKKIEIHTGYSEHSPRINPYKINWHKYGRKLPPYKFMQSPGEHNALGKVKYLFPNPYSVYMHDTNQRNLFVKDYRALSHGCVRLAKPFKLLEHLAEIDPRIDYEKAQKILKANKKTPYRLSQSIPVDIVYLTALADKNSRVYFYDDVYGYDAMQLESARK